MKFMSFVKLDVLHENPLFDMNLVGLHEIHEGGPVELHENPEDNSLQDFSKTMNMGDFRKSMNKGPASSWNP